MLSEKEKEKLPNNKDRQSKYLEHHKDFICVGKIVNIYRDCIDECCTKADRYGISFPRR